MTMTYDRLTADNAAVLFVDHQTGLANGVETQTCGLHQQRQGARHDRPDLQAAEDHHHQRP
jgi:hypothetical protein